MSLYQFDGFFLLDKSAGITSSSALQKVRRFLNIKKAGHTGTLDPFATGLLVCCFGKATKISNIFLNSSKSYIATIKLGEETDTGDLTGQIVSKSSSYKFIEMPFIEKTLNYFIGEIEQIPPMYSALKFNGVPLYKYARSGIDIYREPRKVTVHNINLINFSDDIFKIELSCSKGTYIRTLAQDIGRKLGCFAHLISLRRTRVGPFLLENSITLENLLNGSRSLDKLLCDKEIYKDFI
ncbi:tRNA pseudouridine synthase B [Candidatus Kinetoplastibacterium blastocrithidii TCC012E]|uniref:tRNA pseudouridine synthase B n=1 Tax=Candidatus Kinetoplastidibacterium blastocrithidiae TCC012E TaxID=1208922 RepID=M1M0N4_9PROT|nr:tRNA pseudouridine(55) synthase TruB [Candidatus Kinetoplastibacterium blastocrithidii]AFZ83714.1 tRNA pseudouridine55 synthase [Candidatus Kinetoplastibacterium blastocrithidii (ex Strigomonas culicis)]AGF49836.1 tRNA pseudouridine synthase B [Candidatus Kinetoplastibacterium blastocrithidii TCC012E]